jgi:hypothetical protein
VEIQRCAARRERPGGGEAADNTVDVEATNGLVTQAKARGRVESWGGKEERKGEEAR